MPESPKEPTVRWWVKALVLFHMFAIVVWTMPSPPKAMQNGNAQPTGSDWVPYLNWKYLKRSPIHNYMMSTGFWQYWDMFAPNPSSSDYWVDAEVEFMDGSKKRYLYPRMAELSIPKKYFMERYRKFLERAQSSENPYLWPYFAQRVALEMALQNAEQASANNLPIRVKLFRHERIILAPHLKTPTEYQTTQYFDYTVDQDALRRSLGL